MLSGTGHTKHLQCEAAEKENTEQRHKATVFPTIQPFQHYLRTARCAFQSKIYIICACLLT